MLPRGAHRRGRLGCRHLTMHPGGYSWHHTPGCEQGRTGTPPPLLLSHTFPTLTEPLARASGQRSWGSSSARPSLTSCVTFSSPGLGLLICVRNNGLTSQGAERTTPRSRHSGKDGSPRPLLLPSPQEPWLGSDAPAVRTQGAHLDDRRRRRDHRDDGCGRRRWGGSWGDWDRRDVCSDGWYRGGSDDGRLGDSGGHALKGGRWGDRGHGRHLLRTFKTRKGHLACQALLVFPEASSATPPARTWGPALCCQNPQPEEPSMLRCPRPCNLEAGLLWLILAKGSPNEGETPTTDHRRQNKEARAVPWPGSQGLVPGVTESWYRTRFPQ